MKKILIFLGLFFAVIVNGQDDVEADNMYARDNIYINGVDITTFIQNVTSGDAITGVNGLFRIGNEIGLGGTLSVNTQIKGDYSDLYLGTNSSHINEFYVYASLATINVEDYIELYVNGSLWRITEDYILVGSDTLTNFNDVRELINENEQYLPFNFNYTFSSLTEDSRPGSGYFRLNNATYSNVTQIYIDVLDLESIDKSDFISIADTGSFISIYDKTSYINFEINGGVTDLGNYYRINVDYLNHNGVISGECQLAFDMSHIGGAGEIVVDTANHAYTSDFATESANGGIDNGIIYGDSTFSEPPSVREVSYAVYSVNDDITITLPPLSTCSTLTNVTRFKFTQAGDNAVTIKAYDSEDILGQNQIIIAVKGNSVELTATPGQWAITQDSRAETGLTQSLYALPTQTNVGGTDYYELTTDRDSAFSTTATDIFSGSITDQNVLVAQFITINPFTTGETQGGVGTLSIRNYIDASADNGTLYTKVYTFENGVIQDLINDTTTTTAMQKVTEDYSTLSVPINQYTATDSIVFQIYANEGNGNPNLTIRAGGANTTFYSRSVDIGEISISAKADGNTNTLQKKGSDGNFFGDSELIAEDDTLTVNKNLEVSGNVEVGDTTITRMLLVNGKTIGTIQNDNLSIQAYNEGSVAGDARGQYAVDLQTARAVTTQVASGTYSTIGGGRRNVASGNYSTIGGGYENTSALGSTVSGGVENTANGGYSTIGGGYENTINAGYSTIGGGYENTANVGYSTISGGSRNITTGNYSTIGGGSWNITTSYAEVAFGQFSDTIVGANGTQWIETDPLFKIGNGTSTSSRNNAFILYKNGNAVLDGDFQATTYYGDGSNLTGITGGLTEEQVDSIAKEATMGVIQDSTFSLNVESLDLQNDDSMSVEGQTLPEYVQSKNGKTNNIRFFGNSITYGSGATSNDNRYSTLLSDSLNLNEVNLGVPGSTMSDWTSTGNDWSWSRRDTLFTGDTNDIVLIFLSANDFIQTYSTYPTTPSAWGAEFSEVQYYYDSLVKEMQAYGYDNNKIFATTVYSVPSFSQQFIDSAQNVVKDVAIANNIQHIDCSRLTISLAADNIHPNNAGHATIAAYMYQRINEALVYNYSDVKDYNDSLVIEKEVKISGTIYTEVYQLPTSGTFTIDLSKSNVFECHQTGNVTIDIENYNAGGTYIIDFLQGTTGGYSVTLNFTPDNYEGAGHADFSTTADDINVLQITGNSTYIKYQNIVFTKQ